MTSGGTESILSAMKVRPWGGENVAGLIFVRLQAPATCVAGSVYVVKRHQGVKCWLSCLQGFC